MEHQPGQQALQLDVQPTHHVDPSSFDTDVFHYRSRLGWPAWLSPTSIVAAGITFFVASVALDHDEPLLKTVLLAAGAAATAATATRHCCCCCKSPPAGAAHHAA